MSGWGGGHGERLGQSGWKRQADNRQTMRLHRGICHWCGKPGADRVDHVIPLAQGGTNHPTNRRPIHHEPCHRLKTAAEAAAGRAQRSRRRPTDPHPGLKGGGG